MTQNKERATRKARPNRDGMISITIKEEVMNRTMNVHMIVLSALMGMFLVMSGIGHADSKSVSPGHKKVTGVVTTDKGGILTVKTPTGNYTLTESASRRHGHAVPKVGDEVTLVLDENSIVIEAHPKGEEGAHHFYTGEVGVYGENEQGNQAGNFRG